MTAPEAAGLLDRSMRRRGWNPYRLSAMTAGRVSPSSIRAYLGGRSQPRPDKALAIAEALGPDEGERLLRLLGYQDLADGFAAENELLESGALPAGVTAITYQGPRLSEPAADLVLQFITWLQAHESLIRDR